MLLFLVSGCNKGAVDTIEPVDKKFPTSETFADIDAIEEDVRHRTETFLAAAPESFRESVRAELINASSEFYSAVVSESRNGQARACRAVYADLSRLRPGLVAGESILGSRPFRPIRGYIESRDVCDRRVLLVLERLFLAINEEAAKGIADTRYIPESAIDA